MPAYKSSALYLISSIVPFLLFFSFAFTPHHAETKSSLGSWQQMTNSQSILSSSTKDWLRIIQKKYDVPGIAVEIVASPPSPDPSAQDEMRSEILTFGSRTLNGDPLTPDSLFCISSNTKLFVAISIGILIHRNTTLPDGNTLGWNTKMIDVLTGWGLVDKEAEREATIHDLLTMRTGVPFHPYAPNHADPAKLLEMVSNLPPFAPFRTKWQYNNDNYLILAHLVSRIAGQPFTEFVQTSILKPLGMNSAVFDPVDAKKTGHRTDTALRVGEEMEVVYVDDDGEEVKIKGKKRNIDWWAKGRGEGMWGAAGLIMSANDVTQWLKELISPTTIPSSILEECSQPHAEAENLMFPEMENSSYGYGQWISYYHGHKVISHYGRQLGQNTIFVRLPEHGIAFGVMNLGDGIGSSINRAVGYTILDELLGLRTKNWEEWEECILKDWVSLQAKQNGNTPNNQVETVKLDLDVEGSYHHLAWGDLNIRRFLTQGEDIHIGHLLQRQTRLSLPTYISDMPGREDWYILLDLTDSHFGWTVIQLHNDHTHSEVINNGIVRVLGSGEAIVNEDGMGMFVGFWNYDPMTYRRITEGQDPRISAEVWFDRVARD